MQDYSFVFFVCIRIVLRVLFIFEDSKAPEFSYMDRGLENICQTRPLNTELDTEIIREFIDRIIVFKAEKADGRRTRRIQIFYNCIGVVELSGRYEKPA